MCEPESDRGKDDVSRTIENIPTRTPSFFGSSRNEGEWSWKRNLEKIAGEGENELTPLALPHSLAVRGMEESERGRETY